MPRIKRWEVSGPVFRMVRRLGRVYYGDVVHLVTGWTLVDETGVPLGEYEETLCNIRFPIDEKAPRTPDIPTCVVCLASMFCHPNDVIET